MSALVSGGGDGGPPITVEPITPVEFYFTADQLRVGALVSGNTGSSILSAYDASGSLLETVSVPNVNILNWRSNCIGLENKAGIRKVTFLNSAAGTGAASKLVLDRLTLEPAVSVPEPTSVSLLAAGVLALLCRRRNKKRR